MHRALKLALAGVGLLVGSSWLSSCGNCGPIPFCFDFAKEHSKEDVTAYHRNMSQHGYKRIAYQGSDARHHHYIARPIDWFVTYRIPKEKLRLKDERPLLKSIDTHYLVNPMDDIWEPVDEQGKRLR